MGNASSLKHHVETAEKTGVIQLSKSNLREIPKDLGQISHLLRTLDLNTNRLVQIGDNISAFKNLKLLNLSHNKLKYVSASIGNLTKLETLILEDNLLEALPNELERLASLKTLNLSSNKFKIFPRQVCTLKNLELVDLSRNEIEFIPDQVSQSQASEINLNQNKLRSLNDSLVQCQKLKILRLDNNMLEVTAITKPILADSKICLLSVENNLFTLKQLQERDGYEQYSERYTSTKRKLI
uniref:Leucine-rich repeat-containing protein 57 n=1 Tax=Aceria tosichella TaxID=561515 RepID=A0A6G1SE93_9ACAR